MKFSKAKKEKMKKRRQATIARASKNSIGLCIERWEYDETIEKEKRRNIREINAFFERHREPSYNIVDKATIGGDTYLLGESMCYGEDITEFDKVVIFKVLPHFKYSRLSSKRLLENKSTFEASKSWERESLLEISDEGMIISVS